MASSTSAGTKLAVSLDLPPTLDAPGFSSLAFTEVGGLDSIAAFGAVTAVNGFQPLAGGQQKHKGPTNYGSLQLPLALDGQDAGQTILRGLAEPGNNALASFQVTYPNGDKRFFRGRVFGFQETPGGATNVLMATTTIEISTKVVKVDPRSPHEYWRINITAINGGSNLNIARLEFHDAPGGADLASGGAAISGGDYGGYPAVNAFDGNDGSYWYAASPPGNVGWIGYHFAAPVTVGEVLIRYGSSDAPSMAPRDFAVQFSDDGLVWTTAWAVANSTGWSANSNRTFADPAAL